MSRESAVDKSAYGNNKLAQWGVADDQLTSVQQWLASMMLLGVVSAVYDGINLYAYGL